jgi:hypothetical protein
MDSSVPQNPHRTAFSSKRVRLQMLAVAGLGLMAMEAAIIRSAAFEFDRDDIESAPIMSAAGTRIGRTEFRCDITREK